MSKGQVTDMTGQMSFLARLGQRAKNTITGVSDAWFGPLQPLQTMAPPDVIGRIFDYQVGYNINIQPRPYEPGMFADLRNLAQNCDVLRLVIETRKDELEALPWAIVPRKDEENNPDNKAKIKEISDFLQYPDKEHDWSQWLRIMMEEVFVLDACPIYRRPTKKGTLYSLDILDGSTIAIKIDETGRKPVSPNPSYQQILKGIPATDYTLEELVYLQRNPRAQTPYGFGPVEQIIITVNTQIRRMVEQLTYFTEGNVPLGFANLPKEYTPEQIIQFQRSFDAMREGNQAQRSKLVMVPSDFKYQPVKDAPLKNELDEWLARKICFAFSISAEPFVSQLNRSTAEMSSKRAEDQGLTPLLNFLKRTMDKFIREDFQAPHLEWIWQIDKELDPMESSNINVNYVKSGIKSIDEARQDQGLDALGGPYAIPSLATGSGYIPVGQTTGMFSSDGEEDPTNEDNKDSKTNDKEIDKEIETKKIRYGQLIKRGKRKPIPFTEPQPVKGVRL